MEDAENCILCSSDHLKTILSHTFRRPGLPGSPAPGVVSTYVSDRLSFLFECLVAGSDETSFRVEECRECGMVFNNPRLTVEEMAEKYRYLSNTPGTQAAMHKPQPPGRGERADFIYGWIRDALRAEPRSLRILDYGGGDGLNLVPFARENDCLVVDYVEHPAPPGVRYVHGDVESMAGEAAFDVILLCHTLEHLAQPVELVRRLGSHLADEGLLYLEVPVGVFREWRKQAEPLTHINFFSEATVARCLNEAGLFPGRVSTDYRQGTSGRSWAISAIASREKPAGDHSLKCRGTRRQMVNPVYYIRPGLKKLRKMARRS